MAMDCTATSKRTSVGRWCRAIISCLALVMLGGAWGVAAPHEVKVTEVAPGVYFRKAQTEPRFTGCNQGWVIFRDFVLLIDANFPGQAEEVVATIRKVTDKPIRFVFDTHYHGDHADGNVQYVKLGATIVAQERSQPLFETKGREGFSKSQQSPDRKDEYGPLSYAIPSLYFSHKLIFDDGTQRVELLFLGHAHTAGDAVAWLPQHGILFTGDACVNGAFNYTGDSHTESWIAVLGGMSDLSPKQVAPGHGELGGPEVIANQRRYLVELREAISKAIASGKSLEQIKQEIDMPFYRDWAGVDVKTRTENIEHVHRELTGASLPLSHYQPFIDWLKRGAELPDMDQYAALADLYLTSDTAHRKQLRDYFAMRHGDLKKLRGCIQHLTVAVDSRREPSMVAVRRALACAALEGGREDFHETRELLALLRQQAAQVGLEVEPLFVQIQQPEFVATETRPLFVP